MSSRSTSQTGQTDMAEMAERLGEEAMINAWTQGECHSELLLFKYLSYKNDIFLERGKKCKTFICFFFFFFREGGREWDSGRKMEGDRTWQSMNTCGFVCVMAASSTDCFHNTKLVLRFRIGSLVL